MRIKRAVKRITGAITVAVAMLGIVFSVFAIVETWSTADRLQEATPVLLGQVENAVVSLHRQGEMAVVLLTTTRDRLVSIQNTVEELSRDVPDGQIASILGALDTDVAGRLDEAEDFVRSMQSGLRSAGSALLLMESVPFLGATLSQPAVPGENNLKNLASSLTKASEMLEQATDILVEFRVKKAVDPRQVSRLKAALGHIDDELRQVQSDIEDFSAATQTAAARLSDTKGMSPQWIHRAAVLTTVFFVCFTFSQICVLSHGWSWLRTSSS